jgi:hypothetical protein
VSQIVRGPLESGFDHLVLGMQPAYHAPRHAGSLPLSGKTRAAELALSSFPALPWGVALTGNHRIGPLFVIFGF